MLPVETFGYGTYGNLVGYDPQKEWSQIYNLGCDFLPDQFFPSRRDENSTILYKDSMLCQGKSDDLS